MRLDVRVSNTMNQELRVRCLWKLKGPEVFGIASCSNDSVDRWKH